MGWKERGNIVCFVSITAAPASGMRLLERPRRRSVPWVFQDQSELQSIVPTVPTADTRILELFGIKAQHHETAGTRGRDLMCRKRTHKPHACQHTIGSNRHLPEGIMPFPCSCNGMWARGKAHGSNVGVVGTSLKDERKRYHRIAAVGRRREREACHAS